MAEEFYSKVTSVCSKVYTGLKSLAGLVILLILYNIIGAIIFVQLEAQYEQNTSMKMKSEHENLLRVLYNVSSALKGHQFELLRNETKAVIEQYGRDHNQGNEKMWDFWKSMFFCGTIYTTIGYGNIIPKTNAGKIFSIFYAAFGIPLAMKVLAVIGKKLTVFLKFFYFRLKLCCCQEGRKNTRYTVQDKEQDHVVSIQLKENGENKVEIETEKRDEMIQKEMDNKLPIVLPIIILVLYIFLGSLMYTLWEDWGYLDAIYFVFISVSTIGFGDITPAHTKYFIVTSVYVFVGLALVSMCINVLMEFYILSLKAAWSQVDKVTTKVKKGCHCGSRRQSI